MKKGIDVSYFQGNINWEKVKNNDISFAILRDGYGRATTDKKFFEYIKNAKNAGVNIPAIYHFSYALSAQDAVIEANYACNLAKETGLPSNTIIFYDFEYDSVDYAKKKGVYHNSKTCIACTQMFCDTVRKNGFVPGVYANADYWYRFYNNGTGIPSDAVFWLADWTNSPKQEMLDRATYRQYSEKGVVNGVNGNVDLDYFLGEKETITYKELTNDEITKIATDVINGLYGNGEDRMKKLEAEGYNYNIVQSRVNELIAVKTKNEKLELNEIVEKVIAGEYGNGEDRMKKLEAEGYDYQTVQKAVNNAVEIKDKAVSKAKSFDKSFSHVYTVTASVLNLRYIPGLLNSNNVIKLLYKGEKIRCWGYYTEVENVKWLLIQNGSYTGYIDSNFVKKV